MPRLGQAVLLLVCLAVVIGALLGFVWVIDRAVELMYLEVHPSSTTDG